MALGVTGAPYSAQAQGIPGLGTGLPAIGIPTLGRQLGGAPIIGVPLVAPMVLDGLNSGGFNIMGGVPQVVSDAVLMNFLAVGGDGSGGGLGAGGVFFVGPGSSLIVNNATFVNNWAVGGNGGASGVLTGGTLNGGALIPGTWDAALLAGQAAALPLSGLPGLTPFDPPTGAMMGDGNGNGLSGTNGGNAISVPGSLLSPIPLNAGGAGGQGGTGQAGWATNPKLMADISNAQLDVTAATIDVAVMTAEIVAWAAASPATAGASVGAGAAAAAGLASSIISLTTASTNLATATTNLAAWQAAMVAGSVGIGGPGGRGGVGGNGSFGLPGGAGGNGGSGGIGGNPLFWGPGGDGGPAGISGFGAGGSQGGNAGGDGILSALGTAGAGGMGGFGAGTGSSGTGLGISAPQGGEGGSGLGGAVFIHDNALTVTFSGNTRFAGNGALAGGSLNEGAAGDSAGSAIFLHGQANVNFWPDAIVPLINTIVVQGANAIADSASTKSFAGSQQPQLQGGSVTIGAGLTVFAPGTGNSYSGATNVGNPLMGMAGTPLVPAGFTRLRADDGDGLPQSSKLVFDNGGVLETRGTFNRFVGTNPGQLEWAGSGGFAAHGGALTVTLNGGLDINWGAGASVSYLNALVLGSPTATHDVTLTNNIFTGLVPLAPVQIQVVPTFGDSELEVAPNSTRAILTGNIYGLGSVIINDLINPLSWGTLEMRAPNLYLGPTVLNGGRLELTGLGSIATSAQLSITNPLAVFDISGIGLPNVPIDTASIVSLSGVGTVELGDKNLLISGPIVLPSIFAGTIEGSGDVSLGIGLQGLAGTNTYTGSTTIGLIPGSGPNLAPTSILSLIGNASIEASSGVHINADGMLDISLNALAAGARIKTLSGSGGVNLGALTLTLTQASGTFSGSIGGSGNVALETGSETLTGSNGYAGTTTIGLGNVLASGTTPTTLSLAGNGAIPNSVRVVVLQDGRFDISGVTTPSGAEFGSSIRSLAGEGTVGLGDRRLSVTDANDSFAGIIDGTGGLTIAGGHQTLTGANTLSGRVVVDAGARLSMKDGGGIANASGVTANGEFNIAGITPDGVSIITLDGNGLVTLGDRRLTLSMASETFAGSIVGSGGITVAGGQQTLTGTNFFTGRTIINAAATLSLAGNGYILPSEGVTADGTFDISGTNAGASITTLSGSGSVTLGTQSLAITNAQDIFGGVISGSGDVAVLAGTATLTGDNTLTGRVGVALGARLDLVDRGAISASSNVRVEGLLTIAGQTEGAEIRTLSGGGVVELGARTLTFTAGSETFGGTIQGSGGIAATGGRQVLSGANTFTGGVTIAPDATLELTGAGSIATASSVRADGTLALRGMTRLASNDLPFLGASITTLSGSGQVMLDDHALVLTAAADTFSGQISGTGGIVVTGGHAELTGQNTHSGFTVVTGASLTVNSDMALGSSTAPLYLRDSTLNTTAGFSSIRPVLIENSARINTLGNTLTLGGGISGPGRFVADGGGRINLSAGNSYAGGTLITGRTTVAIPADSALGMSGAPLVIESGRLLATTGFASDRPITIGLDGVIDGDGHALDLTGPIVLTALGNTVLFDGTANIAGPWRVDSFGLQVPEGATLHGNGVVSQNTTLSGVLSPGASPGTLIFTAPLTLTGSAVAEFEIDGTGAGIGAGSHDRVIVSGSGNAFTAAGTLRPVLRDMTGDATNTFTPSLTQSFTIIEAQGGVAGTFSGMTQPVGLAAGTRFDTLYTANAITLWTTPDDYRDLRSHDVHLTPNQSQVGVGLNALRGDAGVRVAADVTEALGVLYTQSASHLPLVANRLTGTIYGDALVGGLALSRQFTEVMSDQTAQRLGVSGQRDVSTKHVNERTTVWATTTASNLRVGSDGDPGFSSAAGGVAAGARVRLAEYLSVGAALGYTGGRTTSSRTGARASVDMLHVGLRGSLAAGALWLDGHVGAAASETRVSRDIGVFGDTARSNPTSIGLNAGIEAGSIHAMGGWNVMPSIGLSIDQLRRDATTEADAGPLSLAVAAESATSTTAMVRLRVQRDYALGDGIRLMPSARLQLSQELGDTAVATRAQFVGAPGAEMRFGTADTGRTAAGVMLGAVLEMPSGLAFYARYNGEVRSNAESHAGVAGIRFQW